MKNAEIALLSLLAEKPCHGYEIEQIIEQRGMRDWTEIGFSSIYYLLQKLEKRALIHSSLEEPQGPGPARRVYGILPAGEAALHAAVLEALALPFRSYPPLLLGLANLPLVSTQAAAAALRQHSSALEQHLAALQQTSERQQPMPSQVQSMFSYSKAMIEAELGWIHTMILDLEKNDG